MNTEASIEEINKFHPDIVVNATGSHPVLPPIPGLRENITAGNLDDIFIMINNVTAGKYPEDFCKGKKVLVMGGGSVGLDIIEYFAPLGADCTIVDMLPTIGAVADPITKCSIRETFDVNNVKQYVNTAIQEVKEHSIVIKTPEGNVEELEFDLGFSALGLAAYNPILNDLHKEYDETDVDIYNIGDSVRARHIMEGTMDGRAILNVLDKRGLLDLSEIELA